MLQDSVSDLRSTLADLEKRLHSVDGEGLNIIKKRTKIHLMTNLMSKKEQIG